MIIKYKKKRFDIKNVKKLSEFGKMTGLMFHRPEKCPAMLFEFNKPTRMKIHSLFVFFKFAAVWLDDKNKIIDLKIVKPFRFSISCKKPFCRLIEIPFNAKYSKILQTLVGWKDLNI